MASIKRESGNRLQPLAIGVDIGGTKIAAGVVRGATVLRHERVPTPRTRDATLRAVQTMILRLDPSGKLPIGIGVPGSIQGTRILHLPHAAWLDGVDVRRSLRIPRSRRLVLENDARCFTLAEAQYGAGKGVSSVVGITLGTGVGGGIVFDGELWRGARGYAGEFGHWRFPVGDHAHEFEELLSGGAIARRHASHGGKERYVREIWSSRVKAARATQRETALLLALFVQNVHVMLNPHAVVVGGGASHSRMVDDVNRLLGERAVRSAKLPLAGVVGAAMIARAANR